jgi:CBS domain-containing protein
LPIVEKDGRLSGIVTLGDVRGAQPSEATSLSVWEMNYLLASLKLNKIMTPNPLTIGPDATIGEAARLMLENKISGLPVVDAKGKLLGIITESDIFSMVVLHEWEEEYA